MIFMKFGRRRSKAPTVTILKRRERSFAATGLHPDRLAFLRLGLRWEEGLGFAHRGARAN
jgi:hypothetical protein